MEGKVSLEDRKAGVGAAVRVWKLVIVNGLGIMTYPIVPSLPEIRHTSTPCRFRLMVPDAGAQGRLVFHGLIKQNM